MEIVLELDLEFKSVDVKYYHICYPFFFFYDIGIDLLEIYNFKFFLVELRNIQKNS